MKIHVHHFNFVLDFVIYFGIVGLKYILRIFAFTRPLFLRQNSRLHESQLRHATRIYGDSRTACLFQIFTALTCE